MGPRDMICLFAVVLYLKWLSTRWLCSTLLFFTSLDMLLVFVFVFWFFPFLCFSPAACPTPPPLSLFLFLVVVSLLVRFVAAFFFFSLQWFCFRGTCCLLVCLLLIDDDLLRSCTFIWQVGRGGPLCVCACACVCVRGEGACLARFHSCALLVHGCPASTPPLLLETVSLAYATPS